MIQTLAQQLVREFARRPTINSHSHLWVESERLKREVDALVLVGHPYPRADLIAAGMSEEDARRALSPGLPLEERWRLVAPYWRYTRLTGYGQSLQVAFRDLFGVMELNAATVGPLSEAIQKGAVAGFYRRILHDTCGLETSVLQMDDLMTMDDLRAVDRGLFLPMPRLNRFTMADAPDKLRAIERDYGVSIGSLEDLVEAMHRACALWRAEDVAGVKLSQSYRRALNFQARDVADARRVFAALLRGEHPGLDTPEGRVLEDYLVFAGCRAAAEAGLTIQFHLGLRAGNWGGLEGSTPAPIVALLRAFPSARFDFSHAGYPYTHEAGVLAKTFPNVFLNLSWIQIVSPVGVRAALREWLRLVPYNKLIGYGDDVYYPEMAYGHLVVARENVALVLAEMIAEGYITEETALDVAQALFYDNPRALYRG
jgi:uncharacterized protein